MGKALYRTYRSKSLSEIVGQEHITTALARALERGIIAHAYLFTGPRGTGKTSIARILAHEINQLPYADGAQHLDIIEIDAASNRRIDEIRDLRDKVHTAPANAKYKVYIIDEVHMLTREAFNALLKTLEEPPAHVVFILATTEVHKLPETIISRTQRFAFKPIEQTKVITHLRHIASQENITIDDEALALIARHGDGSFRDSISLLDQIRHSAEAVTVQDVQAALGIAPADQIERLCNLVATHNASAVVQTLQHMFERGYEPSQIARQLGKQLRGLLLDDKTPGGPATQGAVIALLGKLVGVPASPDPTATLEIALLDMALSDRPSTNALEAKKPAGSSKKSAQQAVHIPEDDVQVEPHPSKFQREQVQKQIPSELSESSNESQRSNSTPKEDSKEISTSTQKPQNVEAQKKASQDSGEEVMTIEQWSHVLHAIKKKYNTLYSILKATEPIFSPGKILLTCGNNFYKKRLTEARNRQILTDTILSELGFALDIQCQQGEVKSKPQPVPLPPADGEIVRNVSAPSSMPAAPPAAAAQSDTIATISNIFGQPEVLES